MSKDTHAFKMESQQTYKNIDIDGRGFSEAIKGSNLSLTSMIDFSATGGDEDVIDCVRGSNYLFKGGLLTADSKTRTFITLKGGITGALLQNIRLRGNVRWPWDISLGDHTIYNKGRLLNQAGIVLRDVCREDGRPLRILVLDSEIPSCDTPCRIYRIPKWLVKIWFKLLG